jgi:hypothetical protein
VRLWNHPPHDLDCCLDRAALLTQEGSSANFDTSNVLQCLRLARIFGSTDLASQEELKVSITAADTADYE